VRRAGHHVACASDGEQGLALLAREHFHLLLTDIVMPKTGGIELTRAVHAVDPSVAVILMSAQAELDTVMEGMRAGAVDYVAKPVSAIELAIAMDRALERRRLSMEVEDYRRNLEAKVRDQTGALAAAHVAKEAAWEAALQALVDALDAREQETE